MPEVGLNGEDTRAMAEQESKHFLVLLQAIEKGQKGKKLKREIEAMKKNMQKRRKIRYTINNLYSNIF